MNTDTLIVVAGPTASGKTALAVRLCQRLGGEVVSADSMQVYRGLDIGTAKPTAAERGGIAHHMLDVAEPGERYTAARYAAEAARCVEDIRARGRRVVVCGGTGLYINALLSGAGFAPDGDDALRARLNDQWERLGGAAMHERLRAHDPLSAARLHPNDKKRVLRALEVCLLTGETISAHNARTRRLEPRYSAVILGLLPEPRAYLYERIGLRVGQMLEQGMVQEVRALRDAGKLRSTAGQAIGYKELLGHLDGACTLDEARELIERKTRRYAKRQLTWFRADTRVRWIAYDKSTAIDRLCDVSTKYLE